MGKSNSQTDPRNWVHGKDQNRWNMNRCNLGYTNQSKEANKKATRFQSNAQCIVWQHKNFTNIPKTRAMKGISWTRSKQESYLIPIKHSVFYDNTKILPICQKLEQWKESCEQEANKKATWFQSNAQCIVWQCKIFTNIPKTRAMKGISWTRSKQESYLIPIKHTVYCMTMQKFYRYSKN